jgi:hypothetical protein
MAIVGFAAGSPNLAAAEARLLGNQVDFGNAIKPFYGTAAGARLTSLLRTHILTSALNAWHANADQIAALRRLSTSSAATGRHPSATTTGSRTRS